MISSNKFATGAIVYARIDPAIKLAVKRRIKSIYFCETLYGLSDEEQVYFEAELVAEDNRSILK